MLRTESSKRGRSPWIPSNAATSWRATSRARSCTASPRNCVALPCGFRRMPPKATAVATRRCIWAPWRGA